MGAFDVRRRMSQIPETAPAIVSIENQMPEDLFNAMREFIRLHPQWDQYRLMQAALAGFMEQIWEREIVPVLTDYIRIPNKSPAFDPDWRAHGHMDRAVALFEAWAREKLKVLPGASSARAAPRPPRARG